MDYSKLLDWSPPLSGYAALAGGVNAWGLGKMGTPGGFGSSAVLGASPGTGIFNFRPGGSGNLAVFSAAKAAMGSGTRPVVLCLGDSQEMGYNVQGAGYSDAAAHSITAVLADLLIAGGIAVNKDIGFSHHGASTVNGGAGSFADYDRRFSFNSTDYAYGSDTGITGNSLREATATTAMAFLAAGTNDKIKTWYAQRSSSTGFFSVSDGATLLGTKSSIGTAAFANVIYDLASRAAGKTINVARTTDNANPINIFGLSAYDSLTPAIDLFNCGRFGTKASVEWIVSTNPWSALNAIGTLAPHLVIICLGANDLAAAVSQATITSSLQTIITTAVSAGASVILVDHMKGLTPTYGTAQAQSDFSAAMRSLAISNDIPLIREGLYNSSLQSDSIHPNVAGTAIRAAWRSQIMLAA